MRPPPARRAAQPLRFSGHRDYPFSAAEAWRLLADTDHMNRVVGLPAMQAGPPGEAEEGFARPTEARLAGRIPLRWTEHPFEWVQERRWTVRREFAGGPWRRVEIGAAIEPGAEGGGVRITVSFSFSPRGIAGRLLARRVGPRSVETMLRYCDGYVARRAGGAQEAPPARGRPEVDLPRLERGLEILSRAAVAAELVERLRRRIVEGTDDQVVRVRPYEAAELWGVDRHEALRLFLHATRAGLFDLRWELMCPTCRVPKGEVGSLASLPDRFHCDTCGIDYDSDFDRRVELRFSVSPALRHARDDAHCVGSPLRTRHILAQQILEPGGSRALELSFAEPLRLRSMGGMAAVALVPAAGAGAGDPPLARDAGARLALAYDAGGWIAADGAGASSPAVLEFEPHRHVLELSNRTSTPVLAVLERETWDPLAATAAEVTTFQEFRDLFSSEALAPGQEVGVSTLALLFTDLKGSTSLYEAVGDAPAYGRVNHHFDFLKEKIAAHRGAIVKTIGDAVMGAFRGLDDAVTAALEIQAGIGSWCGDRGIDPPFVLKAGVHHGPVIAVNANGRLDYFGRAVNIAARLGAESLGGDLVLLREAYDEPLLRAALAGRSLGVERFHGRLRGIEGEQELVRLRPSARPIGSA